MSTEPIRIPAFLATRPHVNSLQAARFEVRKGGRLIALTDSMRAAQFYRQEDASRNTITHRAERTITP